MILDYLNFGLSQFWILDFGLTEIWELDVVLEFAKTRKGSGNPKSL